MRMQRFSSPAKARCFLLGQAKLEGVWTKEEVRSLAATTSPPLPGPVKRPSCGTVGVNKAEQERKTNEVCLPGKASSRSSAATTSFGLQHPHPNHPQSPTRHVDGHTCTHQNLIKKYDISIHFRLNHGPCRSQNKLTMGRSCFPYLCH